MRLQVERSWGGSEVERVAGLAEVERGARVGRGRGGVRVVRLSFSVGVELRTEAVLRVASVDCVWGEGVGGVVGEERGGFWGRRPVRGVGGGSGDEVGWVPRPPIRWLVAESW